jgi:lipopolysaccharide biosynthesis glycosyltransferase
MKPQGERIVVTAANDQYCDSLLRMLASLGDIHCRVAIFDLGLSEQGRQRIQQTCGKDCRILDPGWCVSIPGREQLPSYKKVFLAKPFIPELIPGFMQYLWIDADILLLSNTALDDFFDAAGTDGVAICYEDHPSYNRARGASLLRRLGLGKKSYKVKRLEQYFGRETARKWGDGPTLNSGIFCIGLNSPAWRHWQETIREADLDGHEKKRLICDQTCLDLAIQVHRIATSTLPATHNWCLGLADPLMENSTRRLVEPIPPHAPIKVLHATGTLKREFTALVDMEPAAGEGLSPATEQANATAR